MFHEAGVQRFARLCLALYLIGIVAFNNVRSNYFVLVFQILEILFFHYKDIINFLKLAYLIFSFLNDFFLFWLNSHRLKHLLIEFLCQSIINSSHHCEKFYVKQVNIKVNVSLCFLNFADSFLKDIIDELVIFEIFSDKVGTTKKAKLKHRFSVFGRVKIVEQTYLFFELPLQYFSQLLEF